MNSPVIEFKPIDHVPLSLPGYTELPCELTPITNDALAADCKELIAQFEKYVIPAANEVIRRAIDLFTNGIGVKVLDKLGRRNEYILQYDEPIGKAYVPLMWSIGYGTAIDLLTDSARVPIPFDYGVVYIDCSHMTAPVEGLDTITPYEINAINHFLATHESGGHVDPALAAIVRRITIDRYLDEGFNYEIHYGLSLAKYELRCWEILEALD